MIWDIDFVYTFNKHGPWIIDARVKLKLRECCYIDEYNCTRRKCMQKKKKNHWYLKTNVLAEVKVRRYVLQPYKGRQSVDKICCEMESGTHVLKMIITYLPNNTGLTCTWWSRYCDASSNITLSMKLSYRQREFRLFFCSWSSSPSPLLSNGNCSRLMCCSPWSTSLYRALNSGSHWQQ